MLAALLLLTCGSALPAQPERAQKFQLAINKGSLSSALEQFSRQTGLQVITQLNVSESKTEEVGPFVGRATADVALAQLLKDSDLSYRWQDEYTIIIFAKIILPPRSADNVQEVLVTGTRIPGDQDTPVPVRVYGRGRIDGYGVSSVSDLSRYLTQQPFSFGGGHLQTGAQFIQLRGLGFDTTLVLINGRRAPPSANSISLNAVDLNGIPVTAVDRIEVMSDSASAIYGADAIGGVVNVILKNQIPQPEFYLHYGQADGGGAQRRAAASFGTSGRLKSALVLDYYEQDVLMGEERDLWRNQDYRRFGGTDYRVSTTNPGNVYSLTSQPLPGLSSRRAAVPSGTSGLELTAADFSATDGSTNLRSSFSDWSVTPRTYRTSGYGTAEFSFSEKVTVFGEALVADGEVTTQRPPPSLMREVIPGSNPFNPFKIPVAIDYSFAGMDRISYVSETDLLRLVGGARGSIRAWEWEFTGLRSRESGSDTNRGDINRSRLRDLLSRNDPNAALNFFADGPAAEADVLDSLLGPAQRLSYSFASSQLSAFIRGPMFSIGERKAEFVFGGEVRRDTAKFFQFEHVEADRDIGSAFAELKLPLLEELSLKLALRGDNYEDGDDVVNPQYGLTWRPAEDWLVRIAYGTSFRPPSLFELNMPQTLSPLPIADPRRGGEVSNVGIITGGNPELDVVTARSFTAGFVFGAPDIPGLRVSGNYWEVEMDNRIMAPLYQELLRSEEQYPGRVVRSEASTEDLQRGWLGRLHSVEITRLNYGSLETSGIDLETSFLIDGKSGDLQLDLSLTWVEKYQSRDMNQVLPLDRVGIANVQGTIPEWRAVGSVAWKSDRFGASTTATFTPSYRDADLTMRGPLDRRISSQILLDLQAWIGLSLQGESLFDGSRFTLGARNVFDAAPEFANVGSILGYDYSQTELTGRFMYLRFSKQF
jgi:iron complex outermembrane recepter protein